MSQSGTACCWVLRHQRCFLSPLTRPRGYAATSQAPALHRDSQLPSAVAVFEARERRTARGSGGTGPVGRRRIWRQAGTGGKGPLTIGGEARHGIRPKRGPAGAPGWKKSGTKAPKRSFRLAILPGQRRPDKVRPESCPDIMSARTLEAMKDMTWTLTCTHMTSI